MNENLLVHRMCWHTLFHPYTISSRPCLSSSSYYHPEHFLSNIQTSIVIPCVHQELVISQTSYILPDIQFQYADLTACSISAYIIKFDHLHCGKDNNLASLNQTELNLLNELPYAYSV